MTGSKEYQQKVHLMVFSPFAAAVSVVVATSEEGVACVAVAEETLGTPGSVPVQIPEGHSGPLGCSGTGPGPERVAGTGPDSDDGPETGPGWPDLRKTGTAGGRS